MILSNRPREILVENSYKDQRRFATLQTFMDNLRPIHGKPLTFTVEKGRVIRIVYKKKGLKVLSPTTRTCLHTQMGWIPDRWWRKIAVLNGTAGRCKIVLLDPYTQVYYLSDDEYEEEEKISVTTILPTGDGIWAYNDAAGTIFPVLSEPAPDLLPNSHFSTEWESLKGTEVPFYYGLMKTETKREFPEQGELYKQGLAWYVYQSPDIFGRAHIVGNKDSQWSHITATPSYWVWARWQGAGQLNS